jgi:acyl dehydratase
MLNYDRTRQWQSEPITQNYSLRDTVLYALGIGIGTDPLDPRQLRFVYEKELVAFPTLACVLSSPGFWAKDNPQLGIDFSKVVHGEQSVVMHAALPSQGAVIGSSRVTRVVDKGAGKGAVIWVEKELLDEVGGRLATVEQVLFCRGDGGFSQSNGRSDAPVAASLVIPERLADRIADFQVRPDAALLYRLSGDGNPLHVDPAVASRAGFTRPILHGLGTFGMVAQLLVRDWAAYDEGHLRSVRARLSAPVFPGETLRVATWIVPTGVAFQARVVERDVVVLDNGLAILAQMP